MQHFYEIHIRALIVKIQENNKYNILQYFFTIKTIIVKNSIL